MDLLSISQISEYIGKSNQTIVLWDKQSDELESKGLSRLIPRPIRLGKNQSRYWSKAEAEDIKIFSDSVSYGTLNGFSRSRLLK